MNPLGTKNIAERSADIRRQIEFHWRIRRQAGFYGYIFKGLVNPFWLVDPFLPERKRILI